MTKKKSIIGAMLLLVAFAVSAIAGGSSNSADFTITSGNLTAYTGTDTTIYVPDNTTTISAGAFNNTAIEVIYLPTTITTVENNAFANCSADVKIIFEIATPTSPLPSGMENWGVANAGGQITTYTTSGITTYTLSDVSAIADLDNLAYIKDGSIVELLASAKFTTQYDGFEKIIYSNGVSGPHDLAVDVSKDTDGTIMMWEQGTTLYFWTDSANDKIVMPESMNSYYANLSSLKSIEYNSMVDTSKVTDMSEMFYACNWLETLDLSSFDTSNVTNMSGMFYACLRMETLDVSSFNTSKVTDMSEMFIGCSALGSVNVSSFDTSKVEDMTGMFYGCQSITTLDLSKFNTSKVENMGKMFLGCTSLETVNLSSFDTSNVTVIGWMFNFCSSLTTLDLSTFDLSNIETTTVMFNDCTSLTTVYARTTADAAILQGLTSATVTVK